MTTQVVNWQEKIGQLAKASAAAEVIAGKFVSFKGGAISIGGTIVKDLQVIVVGVARENTYYPNKFNPQKVESPACYAFGKMNPDGSPMGVMAPHADAESKQHATCDGCPQSVWGSDPDSPSGRGKMCKEIRRLAVIPVDALKAPDKLLSVEEMYIRVPVMSVQSWANHVHLLAAHNMAPFSAVTRIFLSPDPRSQFKVNFELLQRIDDNEVLGALYGKFEQVMGRIDFPYSKIEGQAEPAGKPAKRSKVGK